MNLPKRQTKKQYQQLIKSKITKLKGELKCKTQVK